MKHKEHILESKEGQLDQWEEKLKQYREQTKQHEKEVKKRELIVLQKELALENNLGDRQKVAKHSQSTSTPTEWMTPLNTHTTSPHHIDSMELQSPSVDESLEIQNDHLDRAIFVNEIMQRALDEYDARFQHTKHSSHLSYQQTSQIPMESHETRHSTHDPELNTAATST